MCLVWQLECCEPPRPHDLWMVHDRSGSNSLEVMHVILLPCCAAAACCHLEDEARGLMIKTFTTNWSHKHSIAMSLLVEEVVVTKQVLRIVMN